MSDYQTILVPYDFSPHAQAAFGTALDLANRLGAEVHLVHVVQSVAPIYTSFDGAVPPPAQDTEALRESARKELQKVAAGVSDAPGKVEVRVREGFNLAEEICQAAKTLAADLIVMGTHGRTGLAHVFLGSVAERTLRDAPCPVMTVQCAEGES